MFCFIVITVGIAWLVISLVVKKQRKDLENAIIDLEMCTTRGY
jgi:hypothetical protein